MLLSGELLSAVERLLVVEVLIQYRRCGTAELAACPASAGDPSTRGGSLADEGRLAGS